ncbi:DMT family transporter [Periweissella ghanensis]|nr:DMT family transporter [Periweissella ghanensis]
MFLFMLFGVLAGIILANQNPVNAYLRVFVISPYVASLISFSIGTLYIGIVTLATGHPLLPTGAQIAANPWWLWLGGVIAAIYLTSNILLFPKLGAVQTVILPILGQVLMGTVIDSFGLFGAKHIPITAVRLVGVLVLLLGMFVAVVLANRTKAEQIYKNELEKQDTPTALTLWRIWGILAGMLSAVQQAINGRMGTVVHSPVQATFISFLISWLVILIVTLVMHRKITIPRATFKAMPKWGWLGGVLGATFVLMTVILVPIIGAGLTVTTSLIGQILGSVLVTQMGLWRSIKSPVKRLQVIGIIIMLIGVLIIKGIV